MRIRKKDLYNVHSSFSVDGYKLTREDDEYSNFVSLKIRMKVYHSIRFLWDISEFRIVDVTRIKLEEIGVW